MSVSEALMSLLDNNKEKLGDKDYKEMCDELMKLNIKEDTGLYKVHYILSRVQCDHIEQSLNVQIMKLDKHTVEWMEERLKKHPIVNHRFRESTWKNCWEQMIGEEDGSLIKELQNDSCGECERMNEVEFEITIKNAITCFKLEKYI